MAPNPKMEMVQKDPFTMELEQVLQGRVTYKQTVRTKDYESITVEVSLPVERGEDEAEFIVELSQAQRAARDLATEELKAAVQEYMGAPVSVEAEPEKKDVAEEIVQAVFPGAESASVEVGDAIVLGETPAEPVGDHITSKNLWNLFYRLWREMLKSGKTATIAGQTFPSSENWDVKEGGDQKVAFSYLQAKYGDAKTSTWGQERLVPTFKELASTYKQITGKDYEMT